MFIFDLRRSKIYRALLLEKVFSNAVISRIVVVLFLLMLVLLFLWVLPTESFAKQKAFGLFLILSSLTFGMWVYSLFFVNYLQVLEMVDENETNLANLLDFEAGKAVGEFQSSAYRDISAFLFPILKTQKAHFVFFRIGQNPESVKEALENYLRATSKENLEEELLLLLEEAWQEIRKQGSVRPISWRDLLIALCARSDFLRRFLFDLKLEKKDIAALCVWQWGVELAEEQQKKFWTRENLMRTRGVGKGWAAGYTVNLDKYANDVTEVIARKGLGAHLYGRKTETEAIERILARAGENNAVAVGEAGVGKKTIVYALAQKILYGETLPALAHKRVLELDVGAVLAGTGTEREVEGRLKLLLNEAGRAGNVILLIDEIHTLFQPRAAAGTINATELLLPYLSSASLQVVGLTTYEGYHETIAKNPSLLKSFEKVEVHEPSKTEVLPILWYVVPKIEAHDQVLILYQAIKRAIDLADRYIKDVPFPEKAIDVLQEASVYAQSHDRSSTVTQEHVEEVVHQRTEIPVGKIALAEREVLLDLEKILHRRVIGQDEAIVAVANALRRARSGIASEKKPIGVFLFLGPTGVGKTETAKALASVYFGSEARMIRFDMSEYQLPNALDRLIGSGEDRGQLTTAVIENPFSLLLLDEIEKAHPNILNLFLQVFDEGRLTDALGRTVDFTNTIIIATSNAGAEMIRESVQQFREVNLKERLLDYLQKQGIFRPEFLNRFDAIITYKPLTEEQTGAVVRLLLADLNRRLKEKDVEVMVTAELVKKIAEIGYDPQFGARPLRRAIQDRLETQVAKKLLAGEIKRGEKIEINPDEI